MKNTWLILGVIGDDDKMENSWKASTSSKN